MHLHINVCTIFVRSAYSNTQKLLLMLMHFDTRSSCKYKYQVYQWIHYFQKIFECPKKKMIAILKMKVSKLQKNKREVGSTLLDFFFVIPILSFLNIGLCICPICSVSLPYTVSMHHIQNVSYIHFKYLSLLHAIIVSRLLSTHVPIF